MADPAAVGGQGFGRRAGQCGLSPQRQPASISTAFALEATSWASCVGTAVALPGGRDLAPALEEGGQIPVFDPAWIAALGAWTSPASFRTATSTAAGWQSRRRARMAWRAGARPCTGVRLLPRPQPGTQRPDRAEAHLHPPRPGPRTAPPASPRHPGRPRPGADPRIETQRKTGQQLTLGKRHLVDVIGDPPVVISV